MSFTSDQSVAPEQRDDWRDAWVAACARAISLGGDFLAATALVLALQQRGDDGFGVAALLLASTVPMVLLAPVGGRLADRFDSRVLLTAVGVVQTLCCVAMAFTTNSAALVALAALLSAGLAISQPTFVALLPAMVSRASLPKAMAIGQTANSVGMILGPALAGFLVGGFGLRVPLLLDALTYVAVVVAGLTLRTRRGAKATGTAGPEQTWRLRQDPLLARLIPAAAVVIGAISVVNVVLVFFVRETLDASALAYGLIDTVLTIGLVIGAWSVTRFARGDDSLAVGLIVSLAGMGLVFLVASAVPTVLWLVPLYILGGGFNGVLNSVVGLLLARRVPAESRGRAAGLLHGTANGAVAVGYVLAGLLLQVLTPRQCVAASGLAGVLTMAALAVPILRAAKRQPAAETQPAAGPALAVS
jgi:MFS family permease